MLTIFGYSILWFLAGFALAASLNLFIALPLRNYECGLLTMLVGLISLLPLVNNETGRHLFFDGPDPDEDGDPLIGCLWIAPIEMILLTALAWVGWLIFQLINR